jgi:FkbM family methyltransferase
MNLIQKSLAHIRNGTVLERIQWEWNKFNKHRRTLLWNSMIDKQRCFETRIQHGVKMRLYPDSRLSELIYCNDFELAERYFLNAFLKKGDVFVDVGANIGLFTIIAAYRVGKFGKIYSFEPTLETYNRLNENIKLNNFNNVYSYQIALSDIESEKLFFQSMDGYDAWNSLAQPIAGQVFVKQTVQCKRLDDFAGTNNFKDNITMIKIDVEGWETNVIKGAVQILSRKNAPVLLIEFTDEAAKSAGSSCKKLYQLLKTFGYQMYSYDHNLNNLIPDPLRKNYPYVNLIATKNSNYVQNRLKTIPFWNFMRQN